MALIKCPECGGNVSSSAQNCVHCGFRFRVCPDCGTVYSADAAACPQCGYCAKPNAASHVGTVEKEPETEPTPDTKKLEERLSKDYPIYQKRNKVFGLLFIIGIILFVLGVVMMIIWACKEPLDQLLTLGLYYGLFIVCFVIAGILYMIAFGFQYSANKVFWEGLQWFIKEKIDAYDYFVRNKIDPKFSQNENNRGRQYYLVSKWAFLAEHPDKISTDKKATISGLILGLAVLVSFLILGFFIFDDIMLFTALVLTEEQLVVSGSFLALYIIMGIFFILVITRAAILQPFNESFEEWAENYLNWKQKEKAENQNGTAA